MADPNLPIVEPEMLPTLQALVARAQRGDESALPELRQTLDDHAEVWRQVGDMAAQVEQVWLSLVAGPDLLARECLDRKLAELKAEVAGSAPTPLERLLAERIGIAWLQTWHADGMVAQNAGAALPLMRFAGERQDRAQRRLLQAVGALATVRRLLPVAEPAGHPREVLDVDGAEEPALRLVR